MSEFKNIINTFLFDQTPINKPIISIALLCARIYAGYTIMTAGLDKLPMPDWMIDQVTTIGFPFPVFFAWVACFTEFAFGLLLILGFMTRLSGLMLAFTIGVAAFGFHGVLPLIGMHITQHFLWLFVLIAAIGPGPISIDYLIKKPQETITSRFSYLAIPALVLLLATGLVIEFTQRTPSEEATAPPITSINIPGSFNNWDPAANEMTQVSETDYSLDVDFEQAGLIEFKFTANASWDINLGETDQSSSRFPLNGTVAVDAGNTQNIQAYIPKPGRYTFTLNRQTYTYALDSLSTVPVN